MSALPLVVREFIASAPLAHVVTLGPDGDPHVSLAWVGVEDDEIVIGTMFDQHKLRNIRRDGRIALSFEARGQSSGGLPSYLVLRGRARVTDGGAPQLLGRLAQTYIGPGVDFPPMADPPSGWVIRIAVERISGNGDWGQGNDAVEDDQGTT
jgi:PPOX class probable F420-dependent enzyme